MSSTEQQSRQHEATLASLTSRVVRESCRYSDARGGTRTPSSWHLSSQARLSTLQPARCAAAQ
jgi:hypothetical protein